MKVDLNQEILNLIMPDCKEKNITPFKLVKQIILQHYSNKENTENDRELKN